MKYFFAKEIRQDERSEQQREKKKEKKTNTKPRHPSPKVLIWSVH